MDELLNESFLEKQIFGLDFVKWWSNTDISDTNLLEFPEDLKRHKDQVYQLYIKNNYIETLPQWIDTMSKLTHIYVGNNRLSSFPEELSHLKNLEVLCAPGNSITNIPTALSALKRLTQLNLSRNRIKNVPSEIVNMRSLWLLDLSHNEIESLPEIYPEGLYLGELLLNNNRLICVPDNLSRLKNIEYLSVAHNSLLYAPAVVFGTEAKIIADHNPFLNYLPMNIKADHCGTQTFPEACLLPNIKLTCADRDLIVSPKIKRVCRVQGDSHCPSLKEFALRMLYIWKTPFSEDHVPKNIYNQLMAGPAASCMQCLRPLFTYSFICLYQCGSHTHFDAQYFCSKSCYGTFKQLISNRYQNQIVLQELDFKIKPFGFLPILL